MTTFDEFRTNVRIAIHAFDGMTMFHLSTPLAVFGEVTRSGLAEWETAVFSDDGQPVRTAEGLLIADISGPEVADEADLLIFPSWPTDLPPAEQPLVDMVAAARSRRHYCRTVPGHISGGTQRPLGRPDGGHTLAEV